ncbi:MAG: glucose-6-phosphate isomerase [Bacillota bacterium]|nr:glucose-6-phosphate isomerase [Bacillota bacterium]
MDKIKLNLKNAEPYITEEEVLSLKDMVMTADKMITEKSGLGSDFLGWTELPENYDKEEFARIKAAAKRIRENSDVLIVIGIGGSYLGARAAIDMLSHNFRNNVKDNLQIFYCGNNISSSYLAELLEIIEGKDISVNVISKSGTTTEPALAFRVFKELLESKYGKAEAQKRIYATTDKKRGALKTLSDKEGYETFVIADDIGGRYSVLTAVGLLPIAASGLDIDKMMQGAFDAVSDTSVKDLNNNDCYKYAAARNALYRKGKEVEMMVNFEPAVHYFGEWWKQLYGESEGKDGKGIFPAAADFSTDLHSMGQYIQDGRRFLFETFINVVKPRKEFSIKEEKEDLDGLNYLSGKTLDFVNKMAYKGTVLAHHDGGVPVITIDVPELNEYYFGYLVYFFEKACAVSGYLLGVNPFNQPGVEAYKKNMFALLGKKGYEERRAQLIDRI